MQMTPNVWTVVPISKSHDITPSLYIHRLLILYIMYYSTIKFQRARLGKNLIPEHQAPLIRLSAVVLSCKLPLLLLSLCVFHVCVHVVPVVVWGVQRHLSEDKSPLWDKANQNQIPFSGVWATQLLIGPTGAPLFPLCLQSCTFVLLRVVYLAL